MRGHCSARGQIGTVPVRAALAIPARALDSIVGWGVPRPRRARDITKVVLSRGCGVRVRSWSCKFLVVEAELVF